MDWELSNTRKKKQADQHEKHRKELWIGVAIGVSSAETTKNKLSAAAWASEVLKSFDEVFKNG